MQVASPLLLGSILAGGVRDDFRSAKNHGSGPWRITVVAGGRAAGFGVVRNAIQAHGNATSPSGVVSHWRVRRAVAPLPLRTAMICCHAGPDISPKAVDNFEGKWRVRQILL